jgi:hypothetical protein
VITLAVGKGPMQKHTLDLDSLAVETFSTAVQPHAQGVAITLRTCATQDYSCTNCTS